MHIRNSRSVHAICFADATHAADAVHPIQLIARSYRLGEGL